MKTTLIAMAMATVIPSFINAQDCQWKEKKKDSFTNSTYLRSKNLSKAIMGENPAPNTSTFISAYLEASNKTVSLAIVYNTTQELKLKKIAKPAIMFKLSDGAILTLNSENEFDLTSIAKDNASQSVLMFNINRNDLKKLATNGINAIRISFGGADYTYPPKEPSTKEFLNMFSCMDKEI